MSTECRNFNETQPCAIINDFSNTLYKRKRDSETEKMNDLHDRIRQHYRTIVRLVEVNREDTFEDTDFDGDYVFQQAQFTIEDGTDKQIMERLALQVNEIKSGFDDMSGKWRLLVSEPLLQPTCPVSWEFNLCK
ncbi:MAG: hypothetical protein EOP45_11370, partial [Sphingobacteriaceae bacterium]